MAARRHFLASRDRDTIKRVDRFGRAIRQSSCFLAKEVPFVVYDDLKFQFSHLKSKKSPNYEALSIHFLRKAKLKKIIVYRKSDRYLMWRVESNVDSSKAHYAQKYIIQDGCRSPF